MRTGVVDPEPELAEPEELLFCWCIFYSSFVFHCATRKNVQPCYTCTKTFYIATERTQRAWWIWQRTDLLGRQGFTIFLFQWMHWLARLFAAFFGVKRRLFSDTIRLTGIVFISATKNEAEEKTRIKILIWKQEDNDCEIRVWTLPHTQWTAD